MPHLTLFTAKYAAKENIKKCYLRKPSFLDLSHGRVDLLLSQFDVRAVERFLCKHEYIRMGNYSQVHRQNNLLTVQKCLTNAKKLRD